MILNQMLFIYSIKNSKIFLVDTFIASFKIVATELFENQANMTQKYLRIKPRQEILERKKSKMILKH